MAESVHGNIPLQEMIRNPDLYEMGMVPVSLSLPRKPQKNGTGITTTFSPQQIHRNYLYDGNRGPIKFALEAQRSIYATQRLDDGSENILSGSSSAYTLNGDHFILWGTSGDFRHQPTFETMSRMQGESVFGLGSQILQQFDRKNGPKNYFFAFNVNPGEDERQAVQSIKTVHGHIVRLDDEDVRTFQPVDRAHLKGLADPPFVANLANDILYATMAPAIAEDGHRSGIIKDVIGYRNYKYEYPKGTFFVLKDGWDTLRSEEFFPFIQRMQKALRVGYNDLARRFADPDFSDVFTVRVGNGDGVSDVMRRPMGRMREDMVQQVQNYIGEHPELPVNVADNLVTLSHMVRPASHVICDYSDHDDGRGIPSVTANTINTKLFLQGEGYNLILMPGSTGDGLLAVVPRLLSGGSPLDAVGIHKSQYEVAEEEYAQLLQSSDARRDEIVASMLPSNPSLKPGAAFKGVPLE